MQIPPKMSLRNPSLVNNTFKRYLYPILISSMAVSIGAIADGIIVGNLLGEKALSAINISLPILQLAISIMTLIFTGGSILISKAIGRNDTAEIGSWFSTTLLAAAVFSLVIMAIGIFFTDSIVKIMCPIPELQPFVKDYAEVLLCAGIPIFTFATGLCVYITADSSPALETTALVVANVVNIVLDYVFIRYFDMGIEGASIALCIGFTIAIAIASTHLFKKRNRLFFGKLKKIKELKTLFLYGGPASLNLFMLSVKIFFINNIISTAIGLSGVTTMAICLGALALTNLFTNGFSQTMQVICGVMIGSGDQYGCKRTLSITLKYLLICLSVISLGIALFPGEYAGIFGVQIAEQNHDMIVWLRIFAASIIFAEINYLIMMVYQVAGRSKMAFFIAIAQSLLVIPIMYLFRNFGAIPLWSSFVVSEVLIALIVLVCRIPLSPQWSKTVLFQTSLRKYDREPLFAQIHTALEPHADSLLREKICRDMDLLLTTPGNWSRADLLVLHQDRTQIEILIRDNAPFDSQRTLVLGLNQISKSYEIAQ